MSTVIAIAHMMAGVQQTLADSPKPGSLAIDGPHWDDGLSEMCYYAATDTIYGRQRSYTRVHMMNRQWMDPDTGVKTSAEAPGALPVFKFVAAEEIPTENYNYRYLSTAFLRRDDLAPLKLAVSSQEWCGTTFKQLRWTEEGLTVRSFSYFPDEGDRAWQRPADVVPVEALFVIVREVAATNTQRSLSLLPAMRSTHQVVPDPVPAVLTPQEKTRRISVPLGQFEARRVVLDGGSSPGWFDVETQPPYRLLSFEVGGVSAKLQQTERRPHWDRAARSNFYKQDDAP
ncbi:MAG: hypothetical protein GY778_19410 [bacterium]|nr:hypothetical protein [bacterium]